MKPHRNSRRSDVKLGMLENGIRDPSPLLRLLLEFDPAASFNPSGPAMGGGNRAIPLVSALRRVAFPSRTPSQVTAFFDKFPELPKFPDFDLPSSPFASKDALEYLEFDGEEEGTGPEALEGDTVTVQYVGRTRADGKVFDSGEIDFTLGEGRVIQGWDLGVKGMKKGGFRTLLIPARLGYGSDGAGENIPPNADLEFDVEILAIKGQVVDFNGLARDAFPLIIGLGTIGVLALLNNAIGGNPSVDTSDWYNKFDGVDQNK